MPLDTFATDCGMTQMPVEQGATPSANCTYFRSQDLQMLLREPSLVNRMKVRKKETLLMSSVELLTALNGGLYCMSISLTNLWNVRVWFWLLLPKTRNHSLICTSWSCVPPEVVLSCELKKLKRLSSAAGLSLWPCTHPPRAAYLSPSSDHFLLPLKP